MYMTSSFSVPHLMISVVFILFTVWCCQFYWKRRRMFQLSQKVPGPLSLPLIGCAYLFTGDAFAIAKRILQLCEEYPDICKAWFGTDLYYLVSKPEYLEIILNHPGAYEKFALYKFTKTYFGNGLISAPVKIWKKHRKIIAPSLNQKILNQYPETIAEHCHILTKKLEVKCGKASFDICMDITNCGIDIICETLFGIKGNAQNSNVIYSHMFDKISEIVFLRAFRILYHFDFIFKWTKLYKEEKEMIEKARAFTLNVINAKKASVGDIVEDDQRRAFLDTLITQHLKNNINQQELEDEVNTFLLAGVDTNAASSSFVLTLLGIHQDIQEKVYQEAIDILGHDRLITLDDLPKFKYTELVIKETFRMFPSAPFIGRTVSEDIDLGDTIIPKGSHIGIAYLHLHRNEKYWKDPLKFDPDRFLPENSVNRHPYSWLPFSGGPRNCIGFKYGMMMIKIMIPMLIRKFKVRSGYKRIEDIELTTNIVMKPKKGFRICLELR